ncbi:MAG: putative delta-60 repeat protein, partial [Neolewinella sp.]
MFNKRSLFVLIVGIFQVLLLSGNVLAASPDDGFNPNPDGSVESLAVQADGKILMGGRDITIGGVARNAIARLNTDGSLDTTFNPNPDIYARVDSLAVQADGKILMGGNFSAVGAEDRNNIARLEADGSLDTTFNPNANSSVFSLAVQADGKILMGGNFTTVGAEDRNYIARLNADGSLDTTF